MARRVPPLNAARAFEAAARLMSFRKAAAELHVTSGAVAQHVKQLEDWLGTPLFRRLARGVVLTETGQRYGRALAELLDRLALETERVLTSDGSHVLTVSAVPSLATLWLIPRLGKLRARHPELEVRVLAHSARTDFSREDVDVALRLGLGRYPGLRTTPLMTVEFAPVCSPALLAGPHPLREPADLRFHTLLHDEPEPLLPEEPDWRRWLAAMGVTGVEDRAGLRFSHTHMTMQTAAAGQGVALANNVLAADWLAAGILVRPFPRRVLRGPYAYYVVCPEPIADRPRIAAFRQWVLDEAALTLGSIPAPPPVEAVTPPGGSPS